MLDINTQIRKTNINKMKALSDHAETIKQQFEAGRDKVKDEIKTLNQQIEQQQKTVAESYENYVLSVSTLEEYQAEQGKLRTLQETLKMVQSKMDSLDSVQQKKIRTEVFEPMKEIREDAKKELRKINAEKKGQLMQMKADYLKAVNELGRDLIKAEKVVNTQLDYIRYDAGVSTSVYSEGAFQPVMNLLTLTDDYSPRKLITVTASDVQTMLGAGSMAGKIQAMTGLTITPEAPKEEQTAPEAE